MKENKTGDRPCFTTEDGRVLPIKAISMLDLESAKEGLEKEYRARGEPIDPPTYEVSLAGGVTTKHTLTEKNLDTSDPNESLRRHKAWDIYQEALGRMNAEYGRVSRDIFLDGLDVELPSDDAWIERRKKRHIEVPTDSYDRLNYYKMMEVLITPGNLIKLQEEVILLSSSGGVKRSDIEAAGNTFRRELFSRAEKNTARRNKKNVGREEDNAGGLGAQSGDEPGPRQPRVAHKTKRSRRVSPKRGPSLHDSVPGDPSPNGLREQPESYRGDGEQGTQEE